MVSDFLVHFADIFEGIDEVVAEVLVLEVGRLDHEMGFFREFWVSFSFFCIFI